MKPAWIAFLILLICVAEAAARDPLPQDFAFGMHLEVTGRDALYETPLPLAVYRGVTRGDLGDLCVFNAQGEVVPFALSRPAVHTPALSEARTLPIFPLSGDPGGHSTGLSLHVKRDKAGSIIDVTTGNGSQSKREIVAYLLDASFLDGAVSALELELPDLKEGIVRKVSVEAGNDLEHWTTVAAGATVVRLRYGGHDLERRTIDLGTTEAKYFRISSPEPAGMPKLTGVRARMAAGAVQLPRQWISVSAAARKKGGAYEYTFDTAGRMPIDGIRVGLPQENTLVKTTFFSRASAADPWIERQSSLVYRVRLGGEEVRNADVIFSPVSHRYWLLRVDRSGGGLGRGTPRMDFGWIPGKLIFVARGNAPFTLAYGSSQVTMSNGQGNELLNRFRELQKENAVAKVAGTGPQMTLGGESMLRQGMTPQNWRTAFLWAVLVLGVSLLAWMAVHLYRQMK